MRNKICVKRRPYSPETTEANGDGSEASNKLPWGVRDGPTKLPRGVRDARVTFVPNAPIKLPRIQFPAFVRTMRGKMLREPGSNKPFYLPIPKAFVAHNVENMHWSATVTGPGNRDFIMLVGCSNERPTSTRWYFLEGWEEYADFYCLKVGDEIKFILLSKHRYYRYVVGKRVGNSAAMEGDPMADDRGKEVKKRGRTPGVKFCGNGVHVCGTDPRTGKPQFLKRLTKISTSVASMHVNIPRAFMRCHQLEGPIHLEAPNGEPWNASVAKNANGDGVLAAGWKIFFQSTNFKLGDLVTFTMTRRRYFKAGWKIFFQSTNFKLGDLVTFTMTRRRYFKAGWKIFFQSTNFKLGDLVTFTMTRRRYFKVRFFHAPN